MFFKRILLLLCLFITLLITNSHIIASNKTTNDTTVSKSSSEQKQESTSNSINNNSKKASLASIAEMKTKEIQQHVYLIMSSLTPTERSVLEERLKKENLIFENPFGITFYKPTYILPFYYTGSPYRSIYKNVSPDDQKLQRGEFKAQLSLQATVWNNIFGKYSSLNVAFSQIIYWQVYVRSQYFREINCDAEVFIRKRIIPNWWINLGAVHQSNGRGGGLERSWNRAYVDLAFSGESWMISLKPWVLIFKDQSSDLHNPDIDTYLGYGRIVMAYKFNNKTTVSLMVRNLIGSGFKKPSVELGCSFPIHNKLKFFVQVFSGYGQSLLEYDHRTNSIGAGVALSDWI